MRYSPDYAALRLFNFPVAGVTPYSALALAVVFAADPNHGVVSGTSVPSIRLTVSPLSTALCAEALCAARPAAYSVSEVSPDAGSAA
jgi:hypothetical protein